jgi:hypothetical protein
MRISSPYMIVDVRVSQARYATFQQMFRFRSFPLVAKKDLRDWDEQFLEDNEVDAEVEKLLTVNTDVFYFEVEG